MHYVRQMTKQMRISQYFMPQRTHLSTIDQTVDTKKRPCWFCILADLFFSFMGFLFLQKDKCIARTACRHWYECSKLADAQRIMWRYPVRFCFRKSQKFDGPVQCTGSPHVLYLVTGTAKTVGVLPIEPFAGLSKKRKFLPSNYKQVWFNETESSLPETFTLPRYVAADVESTDGLVAHQHKECVDIINLSSTSSFAFRGIVAPVVKTYVFQTILFKCALYQGHLFAVFETQIDIYDIRKADDKPLWSWSHGCSFQESAPSFSVFDKKIYLLNKEKDPSEIMIFSYDGTLLTQWKHSCFSELRNIAVNSSGVYLLNDVKGKVILLSHEGFLLGDVLVCPPRINNLGDEAHLDHIALTTKGLCVIKLDEHYRIDQFEILFENPKSAI